MAVARPLRFLALGTVLIFLYILTHMFGGSVSLRTPTDASTQFRVDKAFRDPNLDGALAHLLRRLASLTYSQYPANLLDP